jgi:hypothetical protein
MNLSYSTATLISLELRSYASDPLPYFQRLDRAREYHMTVTDKGILVSG